jgi:hypothetical protein
MLTVSQTVNKFPTFYATLRFITAITRHRSLVPNLGQINPVPPYPTSCTPVLKLSSHLRQCRPSGLFFSSCSSNEVVTASLWTVDCVTLPSDHSHTSGTYSISTAQITSTLLSSNLRIWLYTSCVTCIAIIPILSQINPVHIVTPLTSFKFSVNVLPTMFRSSKWCLPFKSFNQNSVHTSHLPHTYYKLRPSHSPTPILLLHRSPIQPTTAQAKAACVSSSVPISQLSNHLGFKKQLH